MRQATAAAARNIIADLAGTPVKQYRHRDLGLVVDLGGPAAAAYPPRPRFGTHPARFGRQDPTRVIGKRRQALRQ